MARQPHMLDAARQTTPRHDPVAETGTQTLYAPEPPAPVAVRIAACLRRETALALEIEETRLAPDRPLVAQGLDSLAAAELAAAIETALGVQVPLASLIEGATLDELAEWIGERLNAPVAAAETAAETVAAETAAANETAPPRRYPLSWGQRALWLLDRLAPGNPAYVLAGAGRIGAGLDPVRLRQALTALVLRHSALRTTFEAAGDGAVQVVHGEAACELIEEQAAAWSAEALSARLVEEAHRPFDLERGPLLRVALFHDAPDGGDCSATGNGACIVLLAVHHLAADFWSLEVMLAELGALYRGQALPPPARSYGDFVRRQAALLAGAEGRRLADYWTGALPAPAPPLELPADRPRPARQSFRGAAREARLPRALTQRLHGLGRAAGATPFMTLLAGFMTLLHRATGQDELRVGTPAAGRSAAELSGVVGYLVNPLVLRGDLSAAPGFGDLLAQVRETALGAFAHQEYPFPLLAQRLGGEHDPSRPPVFQAMFALYRERQDAGRGLAAFALGQAGGCLDLGGPVVQSVPLPRRAAQVELSLLAAEIDGAFACSLQFNSDLFDGATIARMLRQLETLLLAVAGPAADSANATVGDSVDGIDGARLRRPVGELPLLGAAERHQLLEWCDTAAAPAALAAGRLSQAAATVHELFEWQAARSPRAVAVAGQGLKLTYGELERRANQLARYLRRLGAGPEVPVALCLDRTPEMVVALLGILKAGGAYVPLDPAHPPQRLRLVLADSAAPLLVCEERWLPLLGLEAAHGSEPTPGREPTPGAEPGGPIVVCLDREREWIAAEDDSPPGVAVPAESLAYVIYTSGSTGLPKGVGLPHRALVCFLRAMAERPGLGAGDVMAALTTLAFDIAGLEIYLPLAVGGRVEVVGAGESADGRRLAARLAEAEATAVQATPATWRLLLDAGWQGGAGLKALCGGEALPWDLAAALLDRRVELWNLYGPTETAVWSATARVGALPPDRGRRADGGVVALGRAIANTHFAVVDRRGQPLPPGVAGELLIGGAGVARGYWRRPELTAERFVPDPVSGAEAAAGSPAAGSPTGARRYRTGDLVRWRPDGELEFLGRIDHQVKVRGHRIELGEVESALARLPGVGQAVVAAHGAATDRRLVAYLVARRDASPAPTAAAAVPAAMPGFAELRGLLRQTLPEYMLPADFVVLDRLPVNPSGKVDRRALPAPSPPRPDGPAAAGEAAGAARHQRLAPRTPAEELIAGIWAEVLDLSPPSAPASEAPEATAGGGARLAIAVDDDFFRLGGHSLLAVRVAARLRDTLGVELPLARLLQLSRLEDLAREVESLAAAARPRAAPIARLARTPRAPREAAEAGTWESALSFAQERLWFIEQLEPGGATYNEPRALRLAGRLDVAALAASLGQIRRRHEVLRTRFAAPPGTGVPVAVAVASPAWQVLPLPVVDLAALPAASGETAAARLVTEEARRPFDLGRGPLIRAALLRLAPERHVLLLNLHHMVSDGGSLEILARELAVLYGAAVSGTAPAPGALPTLAIQYADFAHWQRELLVGEDVTAAVGWWREQLGGSRGEPPRLDLPLDHSRPQAPSRRGRRRAMALPGGLTGELEALARRHGVTLFMTLLAAFGTLLSRYGGQEDVTVGTPVAKRDRPETENLIGLFVNTLVLRLDLAGDPAIGELLVRTRQTALAAYAHQDVPFERLATDLAPQRGPAETPFFQVFLALQPPPPVLALPGLAVEYLDPDSGTAKFDLSLAFHRTAAGALAGSWTWRRDLFEAATVERLAGHWRHLLAAIAAAPDTASDRHLSDLSLLAPAERHQLLQEWGTAPWEEETGDLVHTPFLRQASLHPDRVALVAPWPGTANALDGAGVRLLTYGALAAHAGALARSLRSMGVGPEEIVGICAETSPEMVAGLLGILKAGGAYLPLAPADPRERIAQLLAESGARVAVADRAATERLPARVRLLPLDRELQGATPETRENAGREAASALPLPENPAYLLYTSGSTGVPKGVVVPHRAVANRLRFQVTADLRPGARVLHRTRLGFDVSVVEIFAPLWAGATVVLTPPALQQDAAGLARLILEQEVTNFNAPPALLSALLAEESLGRCRNLRKVVTGSDRIPADLPRRYYAALPSQPSRQSPPAPLVARYGPTEATVSVSEWHCLPASSAPWSAAPLVPLGRPIAGARLRVLDRRDLGGQAAGSARVGNELPAGAPGELCIAGPCLARGYLDRPDLTAAAFLPDPFARQPETAGGRLYRTGDLVRFRADGSLEFLGRIDNQVKVRGYRVEVGEVEAALQSHPAVERAVVAADRSHGGRLVAYLVARRPRELDASALRTHLGGKLPEYMIPAVWIEIPAVPLSANGKVDRRALPDPDAVAAGLSAAATIVTGARPAARAVRTPAEELLAGVWTELLGIAEAAPGDDFFALGGHSLLATQLVSRVRGLFGVELPLRQVFEHPTLQDLARQVLALSSRQGTDPAAAPAARIESPLSFAQQRLWFVDQLEAGSVAYNMAFGAELTGDLGEPETALLRRTLTEVARRHQALRTRFVSTPNGPVQLVAPPAAAAVPVACLAGLPEAVREREARRVMAAEARRPFDLGVLPLVRTALLRLAPRRHLLVATQHHIISDGWSAGVMLREVAVLYSAFRRGLPSPLPELPIQYSDFARWQRQWLQGEVLEAQLAYWRGQLAGAPLQLQLPADRPRPLQPSRRGGVLGVALPAGLSERLAALSRREEVTLFMTLAAAFGLLLGRHANQEELLLGTPIANRNRHETEALIGFFVNTLVLRLDLSGRPAFSQLLRRVHDVALGAYAHQDLPFERLVEEAAAGRDHDPRQAPLVQAVLVLQNAPLETLELPGLGCRTFPISSGKVKFDLTLSFGMRDGQLAGSLEYDGELFDPATARRLAARCETLLEAVAADAAGPIDELPLLSPAERHQVVGEWGHPAAGTTGTTGAAGKAGVDGAGGEAIAAAAAAASLSELFERQVRRAPGARAVTCEGDELTYGELNRRANQLAHRLRELGVGGGAREERVGLCVERSLELIVGVLGILKAGAAYVPIDPGYPRERRSFIAADAGLRAVVGTASALGDLPLATIVALDAEAADLSRRPGRDSPPANARSGPASAGAAAAYVIYTSGSTGKPKGVVVTHANVIRLFTATRPWLRCGEDDVWTLFHSYAFDFSVWEIWGALLHGGRLVVVPYLLSRAPDELHELLVRERVTVLNQTPSAFAQLMRADEEIAAGGSAGAGTAPLADLADLRLVIFGGEALEPSRLAPWFRRHGDERPRLVNMYGITETTVHVTARRLLEADALAGRGSVIGRPIPDLATYVLDAKGHPAAIGVAGELAIGGAGLARGYLGRPELTAERFVPDPFCGQRGEPGARLYRSGDLGRFLPDDGLEYLGRIDQQVKIRGFRIELGEIQAALAGHPQVHEAVVLAKAEPQGGDLRLVAYVVPQPGVSPAASDLRAFVSSRLPEHMVPAAFVPLAALPLTANGKVDRRALLAISTAQRGESRDYQPATNETEGALAEIWEQVLGLDRVGIDDRFFSLGGDSILSLRVRAAAAARGLHFTLPRLFEHQTVRELARHLEPEDPELAAAGDPEPFALLTPGDRGALPGGLDDAYPLTTLQQGMLFHSGFSASSSLYHNVASFKVAASLDEPALREAVALLLARHPVLRTSFDLGSYGEPLQLVHSAAEAPLAVEDLRGLDESEQERLLAAAFADERQRKLDPGRAPLLRFRAHRLAEDRFQLTWAEHHAILDGWSMASMMSELSVLYDHRRSRQGRPSPELPAPPPPLPPLPPPPAASFRQFVALERRAMASEEARRHWERQLAGAPGPQLPLLPLPEGEEAQAPRARDVRRDLGAPRTLALKRLAAALGAPLKSVLLAAHFRTLAVFTGQTELATGLVVNGRPEVRDGERVLGLFLNTLPLRFTIRPGSWSDLIRQAAAAEREVVAYRRYPMALIKVAARGGRDGRALFDSAFNYNHFHVLRALEKSGTQLLGGNVVGDVEVPYTASFALDAASSRLTLTQQLDERVLPAWQVEKIAGCMTAILDAMVAHPEGRHDAAPLLGPAEVQQLVREWNDTAAVRPERRVHELFAEQAAARPDAAAVIAGAEVVTYGELRRRAKHLAHHLRSLGAGPEVRVALLLERSPELVAGVLAVLESGAAYVPLDPDYPPARLAAILTDSGARILLTRAGLSGALGEPGIPTVELDRDAAALERWSRSDPPAAGHLSGTAGTAATAATAGGEGLAYVIYTSGSTGLPKGVLVSHAAVVNEVLGYAQYLGMTPDDRPIQFSSISFDASVEEIFGPLLTGCPMVLRDAEMLGSPRRFLAAVERQEITMLLVPTAFWHELAAALVEPELQLPRCVRLADVGGERVRPEQVARWLARGFAGVSLVNSYGPTEITIVCSRMRVTRPAGRGQEVPIGRPTVNSRIYLLGPDLQPLPQGAAGMLFVSGRGVARGYHGRPDLTAERFLPDPWSAVPGARMYSTGDLAVHRPNGEIEYRGRRDDQVKIRGFRIEPGEIELVLAQHPAVRQAVVAVREDARRESALAAYVVAAGDPRPAAGELRLWLRERLPAFMMPAAFVLLDRLPVNANGKLDRAALPAPDWGGEPRGGDYLAPRDALELRLAGLWQELLPGHPVGVRDDFFELGGHSLLAVQLMARIQKSLGRSLPTATLLRHPTIERLAALLRDGGEPSARTALVEMAAAGGRPFFCVHPVGGDVLCYVHLARHLATGRRIFGLQVPERNGEAPWTTIEEMAAHYLDCVREVQPVGPYSLGGWSMGGMVAFEMARQLEIQGQAVDQVVLIDAVAPRPGGGKGRGGRREGESGAGKNPIRSEGEGAPMEPALVAAFAGDLARLYGLAQPAAAIDLAGLTVEKALARVRAETERLGILPPGLDGADLDRRFAMFEANYQRSQCYAGGACAAPLLLLKAAQTAAPHAGGNGREADLGWGRLAGGQVEVIEVPGDHYTLLQEPHVQTLASLLRERCGRSLPALHPDRGNANE
jgi:amino acid adenylation domain-containing protein